MNSAVINATAALLIDHTGQIVVAAIVTWFVLFHACVALIRGFRGCADVAIPEATEGIPHARRPNTVQGYAFLVISTLHSVTVAVLSLNAIVAALSLPSGQTADDDRSLSQLLQIDVVSGYPKDITYVCGYLYMSWVLFEIVFFSWYWRIFGTYLDMLHHVLFAVTGAYFMSAPNVTAFYAGILMMMECSTPWLNLFLAFRHHKSVCWATLGKVKEAAALHVQVTHAITEKYMYVCVG